MTKSEVYPIAAEKCQQVSVEAEVGTRSVDVNEILVTEFRPPIPK